MSCFPRFTINMSLFLKMSTYFYNQLSDSLQPHTSNISFKATSHINLICVKVAQKATGTAPWGRISLADGYKQELCSISWSSPTRWSHLISNVSQSLCMCVCVRLSVCPCVYMSILPLQSHKQPAQTMSDSFTSSSDINKHTSSTSADRLQADRSGH